MLWHFSDPAVASSPRVRLHALDVLPERVWVHGRLQGAVVGDYAHQLHSPRFLEQHLKGLVDDAPLESLDVSLVLFIEDALMDEEVRQAVGEDVDLELDLGGLSLLGLALLRLYNDQGDSLDDLWELRHRSGIAAVQFNQVQRTLAWEEHLDLFDAATDKLTLLDLGVLVPGHEASTGELFKLAAEEVETVLSHVLLVPLEEVVDEVVHLREVGPTPRVHVCKLLTIVLRCEQVLFLDFSQLA